MASTQHAFQPQHSVVSAPAATGRPKLNRMQSLQRMRSRLASGTKEFLGLDEQQKPTEQDKWTQRRLRLLSRSLVGNVKKECLQKKYGDETDSVFMPNVVDPLAKRGHFTGFDMTDGGSMRTTPMSSTSTYYRRRMMGPRKRGRKDSVMKMAWDGVNQLVGRKPSRKSRQWSRSFAPASITSDDMDALSFTPQEAVIEEEDMSLVDDVFFDIKSPTFSMSAPDFMKKTELETVPEARDEVDVGRSTPKIVPGQWHAGHHPRQGLPSTPGTAAVAVHPLSGVGMRRIVGGVMERALDNSDRRRVGMGIIGRIFKRSFKRGGVDEDVREQIDKMHDHRPFFTFWVTFVQIAVYIVSVSVYGIAPVGFSDTLISDVVLTSNLALEKVAYYEKDNMWIGPRQADLIHLGAKYSPCMRRDRNVIAALETDKSRERETACCIRNAREDGCVQKPRRTCSPYLSTWWKWGEDGRLGFNNRTNGSVCGQDPEFCLTPASTEPYVWPDDITKWPLCVRTEQNLTHGNESEVSLFHPHMTCEIRGRPCCIGIQGECIITTPEHCKFRKGYYHKEAALCSQVNCMNQICGMIQFLDPQYPDQFYRLWTSLFLHAGLFHLVISIIFQMLIMRDVEKLAGWIRVSIIYIVSGIAGNLASAIFLPYQVEAGPAGSQFGILSCLFVEVLQSWQLIETPWKALLKQGGVILALFILGLLPWIDNYAHLVGFFTGFLLSFALLPYVTFGDWDKKRKIIGIVLSVVTVIAFIVVLFILFYVVPIYECPHCSYFNCIPFTPKFCENMEVKIGRTQS